MLAIICWLVPGRGEVARKIGMAVGCACVLSGLVGWLTGDWESDGELPGPMF